ncbi:BrxA family protein, partial [Catenibacterium sp.]
MRIVASLLSEGKSEKEIVEEIANNNLFQYQT